MAAETVIPFIDRTAQPFTEAEVAAIQAAAKAQSLPDQLEVVSIAGKSITNPAAVDEELQRMRVKKPGETIFNWQQIGPDGKPARYDATMTGVPDDMIEVVVYDRKGFPVQMKKSMALIRLGKRHPDDGQPVFFVRPPVQAPTPELACLSKWTNCRKRFFTEAQQRIHFEKRHTTEYQQHENDRRRENERRAMELQEQAIRQGEVNTAALMAIMQRFSRGEPVTQDEVAAVTTKTVPFEFMSRDQLKAYCDQNGIPYPADWQKLSKARWIALAKGEEGSG